MTTFELLNDSCPDALRALPDDYVDAVVTDPPYEIGFADKTWDKTGIAYRVDMWEEVLRVMKPGAHLLSFGGPRTFHRVAVAIEDAGFEIRDTLLWLNGQGFPKSYNISKGIDKALGAERPVVGYSDEDGMNRWNDYRHGDYQDYSQGTPITAAGSEQAAAWEGWGTTLKPAFEPIIMARKPFKGGVARNVMRHGVGGINIDDTRIEGEPVPINVLEQWSGFGEKERPEYKATVNDQGRWPANVLLDEDSSALLDEIVGDNVSRFFYCAKATKKEKGAGNGHSTVKPLDLMRYLVRLVTPPGGLVLDQFMGTGSTGIAAVEQDFRFLGFDMKAEHVEMARARFAERGLSN